MVGGIIWLLLLPLDQYSRRTYISENALLPGQVHTYFSGTEQNIFRAYRHELAGAIEPRQAGNETAGQRTEAESTTIRQKVQELFHNAGVKTARQRYSYSSSGRTYRGENVYGVLRAPRGDGTEAIVLVAALRNAADEDNLNGVTLLLTLSRYFSRWSLWSKDIIFLVTHDSRAGPQAWIDAYHSTHDPVQVEDLPLKSGALQGAVCIDYPFFHRFETLHVSYDGINGQLPNLDLINTAATISSGQMGIGASIQGMHRHSGSYSDRLETLVRGMASQALGQATGPHSVFMRYHIDAITLTAAGEAWQDEMAFGRTVESIVRSLNNLLEHLHQSFFFYLLMQKNRFVSIGTYLPSAMVIAAGFTIMALNLWVKSGYEEVAGEELSDQTVEKDSIPSSDGSPSQPAATDDTATAAKKRYTPIPRHLFLPLSILVVVHAASLVPLYALTTVPAASLSQVFFLSCLATIVAPIMLAAALPETPNNTFLPAFAAPRPHQYPLLQSLSLLILGLELTTLATLNFSLSTFLGLLCAPVAFVGRSSTRTSSTSSGSRRTTLSPSEAASGNEKQSMNRGSAGPNRSPRSLSSPSYSSSPSSPSSSASILLSVASYLLLVLFTPFTLSALYVAFRLYYPGVPGSIDTEAIPRMLAKLAFGWNVSGSWGVPVAIWCVWWPAWIVAATVVASDWFDTNTTPPAAASAVPSPSGPGSSLARASGASKSKPTLLASEADPPFPSSSVRSSGAQAGHAQAPTSAPRQRPAQTPAGQAGQATQVESSRGGGATDRDRDRTGDRERGSTPRAKSGRERDNREKAKNRNR